MEFDAVETRLGDGETVSLRRPRLSFRDLAYGPLGDNVRISLRNAPPVFGLGLLEAVPDEEISAPCGGPGRGRPNHVYDMAAGRMALGRFGLKANQPDLRQQIANAFAEDIGISSYLFPEPNCAAVAAGMPRGGGTRDASSPTRGSRPRSPICAASPCRPGAISTIRASPKGEALFREIGCAACHRETMKLGPVGFAPWLSGTEIHPYSDLLLHDMGEGLADGREDFEAGPRDWRTPPLWGLGLAGRFGTPADFLHDGRARSVAEAILWHGGEAEAAADGFRGLTREERGALLAFLGRSNGDSQRPLPHPPMAGGRPARREISMKREIAPSPAKRGSGERASGQWGDRGKNHETKQTRALGRRQRRRAIASGAALAEQPQPFDLGEIHVGAERKSAPADKKEGRRPGAAAADRLLWRRDHQQSPERDLPARLARSRRQSRGRRRQQLDRRHAQ